MISFEINETARVKMNSISTPGVDMWDAAFNYMCHVDSASSFKIDLLDGEWMLRVFCYPEEGSIMQELDDEMNEDIYELDREEW